MTPSLGTKQAKLTLCWNCVLLCSAKSLAKAYDRDGAAAPNSETEGVDRPPSKLRVRLY